MFVIMSTIMDMMTFNLLFAILWVVCIVCAVIVAKHAKNESNTDIRKRKIRKAWIIGFLPIILMIAFYIFIYTYLLFNPIDLGWR